MEDSDTYFRNANIVEMEVMERGQGRVVAYTSRVCAIALIANSPLTSDFAIRITGEKDDGCQHEVKAKSGVLRSLA